MTVKELKARLEDFDENISVVFPDHELGDLLVEYNNGEQEYMSFVTLCETKTAFIWSGTNYGEVLVIGSEQWKW